MTAASERTPESQVKNVWRGPQGLYDFYDPEKAVPTPLVEIPAGLNPFYQDGVRIYAKLHSALPAANVKSLPALNMLREAGLATCDTTQDESKCKRAKAGTKQIVEYSSGSTVISLAILSQIIGIEGVTAYLSNKTSTAKLNLMRFFGLRLKLFGGPSQPEPTDERGGIKAAEHVGEQDGYFNPNQYENDANWRAHYKWTARQLYQQLGEELDVLVAGMGTSGTMTGTGLAIKELLPHAYRIGVTTTPGDRVPGPRSEALLAPVLFPWKESIDAMEWVGSVDSFRTSMSLCRNGLLVGPSSGYNLYGLLQHLEKLKSNGKLDSLRHRSAQGDELIHAVFLCCDGPFQYIDEYFSKLDAANFQPIENDILLGVDSYRYDDAWELSPMEAAERLGLGPSPSATASPSLLSSVEWDRGRPTGGSYSTESGSSTASRSLSPWEAARRSSSTSSAPSSVDGATTFVLVDLRPSGSSNPSPALSPLPIVHLPLKTLNQVDRDNATLDPFLDPAVLREQWLELDALFQSHPEPLVPHADANVLFVCSTGGTSRVATSVARNAGFRAWSVAGGISHLDPSLLA